MLAPRLHELQLYLAGYPARMASRERFKLFSIVPMIYARRLQLFEVDLVFVNKNLLRFDIQNVIATLRPAVAGHFLPHF